MLRGIRVFWVVLCLLFCGLFGGILGVLGFCGLFWGFKLLYWAFYVALLGILGFGVFRVLRFACCIVGFGWFSFYLGFGCFRFLRCRFGFGF